MISSSTQGKLLRILEERKYYRIGSFSPINLNLRIVASSPKNFDELNKIIRKDLLKQLNFTQINIPTLGDRRDDFENLLKELGDLPAESYEGNWAMISEEFDTTEKSALNKILNTDSVVEAAKATSNHYLRPGKPQLNKRVSAAEDIYKRYNEDRSLK